MTELMTLSSQSQQWNSTASALVSGMSNLGIDPDLMMKIAGATQLFTGIAQMGAVASTILGAMRTASTAEAVAETSAKVLEGPTGWATIALASAVAGTIGATIGYWASQSNMTINTDSPAELKMVASMTR